MNALRRLKPWQVFAYLLGPLAAAFLIGLVSRSIEFAVLVFVVLALIQLSYFLLLTRREERHQQCRRQYR